MEKTKIMEKKVSVIVPVHNAGKTLNYCVDSIVNQTYKNLEIILVENGSSDNSLDLCREYEKKDERVKVFVSEKGVSKARNLGLEMMTGDYFAFVDSDDYIDVATYEKLIDKALQENADMTFYLTNSVQNGVVEKYMEKNIEKVVYDKDIRYFFYRGSEAVRTGTIRTLFLSSMFKDVRYDEELSYSEDFIYMLECMKRSQKRALLNEHLYFNVNFHNVPFMFAKKYKGRYHFYESAQIFAERAESYLKEAGCDDILYAARFDGLILLINAIVGTEKHYVKEIKKLCSQPFWKNANNKTNYKQYLKVVQSCGKPVKIKAFLVYHKLYFTYGVLAKLYAKMKG